MATLKSREQSLLAFRREQAEVISRDFAQAFEGVEALRTIAVREARALADNGDLSQKRFEQLDAGLHPFGRLYWLTGEGNPRRKSLQQTPPLWLAKLARARTEHSPNDVVVLRPVPVGMEAGRVEPELLLLDAETPTEYLGVAVADGEGDLFLAHLDLDYVYGAWLKKRLERSALGESLTASLPGEFEAFPPIGALSVDTSSEVWRWGNPTFFADDDHPSPPLVLELDNRPALRAERRRVLAGGSMAGMVMLGLGLSLVLTRRAVQREVQAAEARGRFADMVGHELRTPVAAISMYAEILREGLVEDKDKLLVYHQQLQRQTERLKSLIEKVLTFARLEQGQSAMASTSVTISELLNDVLAVESLGHPVHITRSSPVQILTDPEVVIQILANLLENAAKHSQAESPVELEATEIGQDEWEFAVLDRGPGVPQELRDLLFEPYQSLSPHNRIPSPDGAKRSTQGLGLGLAIARGLAQSLGGRLEFRERSGGGSVFALTLPGSERGKL